jgi:hypothetical protein
MTQVRGKRRGQGEDSIYCDSSKNRYVGAVSQGFSPVGRRIRQKVTGRTKAEVRDKLRDRICRLIAACGPDGATPWMTRSTTGLPMGWMACPRGL